MEFARAVARVRQGEASAEEAARELVAALPPGERLWLLDGDEGFWSGLRHLLRHGYGDRPVVAGALPRIGLPGIRTTDGPRGVVMGRSTSFPVAIARGATWDPELEEAVGRAIGAEARAQGANLFVGLCVNLLRHPAWGRAQETYGEDPVLLGAMGAALARGAREHVMVAVKHFALNSMEDARFVLDVEVDEDDLHEVYLPHFKAVVDGGVDAVMSAYNAVNGVWAGESRVLLTEVLRREWGFRGFVMSDFVWGFRDPVASLEAGLDLEMPFRQQRARALPGAVARGRPSSAVVRVAAERIVAAQVRHAAALGAPPPDGTVASPAHRALARRVATSGMVLLRNEVVGERPLLPVARGTTPRIAVVGALAAAANQGDEGSSAVRPPGVVTLLDGIRAAHADGSVTHHDGHDPAAAAAVAADADLAVVVVGYTAQDEGEAVVALDADALAVLGRPFDLPAAGRVLPALLRRVAARIGIAGGDRRSLRLRSADEDLVGAVAAANPRTVVVVIGGGPVVAPWAHRAPAVLLAWYPGMEGGHAVADVLFGTEEPGGRLPAVVPAAAEHLPPFDPDVRHVVYDRWWGQRAVDRAGHRAAHPLGFGLGYTTFALDDARAERRDGAVVSTVEVTNTGERDGSTVVQVYAVVPPDGPAEHPHRRLLGFARVALPAGGRERITVTGSLQPLSRRDRGTRTWSVVPGDHVLEIGQWCGDPAAARTTLSLAAPSLPAVRSAG